MIYVEGSLKFPNSYRVSQLDAVLRHTQDHITWPLTQVKSSSALAVDFFYEDFRPVVLY